MASLELRIQPQRLVTTVRHCARCDQDHENLEFKRFVRPIEDEDGTLWNYWSLCPNTGDPILLRVEQE